MRLAAIVLPTLLSISLSLQAHTVAKMNFYPGTFHDLRKEAFEEDKPYVLYFSFAGEEASREMENYTFHEPHLSKYISQNYLIYKVSVDNMSRGDDFLEKDFKVKGPSLLIFDSKSYELDRIRGFVAPDILLNSLREHQPERGNYPLNIPEVESSPESNKPVIEDLGPNTSVRRIANEFFQPQENSSNEQVQQESNLAESGAEEVLIIDQYDSDSRLYNQEQKSKHNWKRENSIDNRQNQKQDIDVLNQRFDFEKKNSSVNYTRPYTEIPLPVEQYEEKITQVAVQEKDWISVEDNTSYNSEPSYPTNTGNKKRGFGIQTGVFGQSYFMRQEVEFLQSKFNYDVLVNKSTLNGKPVYKVQIGPFNSEAAARSFEKRFRRVSGNRKGMLVYIQ